MRNFFFFLEGDLLGDSSPSWSPASAGSSASAASASASASAPAGAEAGAEAESSAGSAGASEGSSGVKSGRVCLRVAASLSSLKVCSGRDSDGREKERVRDLGREGHINGSALLSFHTYEAATGKLLEELINPRSPTKTHQTQASFFLDL